MQAGQDLSIQLFLFFSTFVFLYATFLVRQHIDFRTVNAFLATIPPLAVAVESLDISFRSGIFGRLEDQRLNASQGVEAGENKAKAEAQQQDIQQLLSTLFHFHHLKLILHIYYHK